VSNVLTEREYRGEDDRLTEWRRAALERERRLDELETVPDPGYHARNLAARPGVTVRVDSFLGTINTPDSAAAYAAPAELVVNGFAFRREEQGHPRLVELRERFQLDEVAGTGTDLERAILLREWIKSVWAHAEPWRLPVYDGLLILDRASRGVEGFICMHYSVALIHSCLALGIQARLINLHRGVSESYRIGAEALADPPVDEHVTSEIWSRELGKWVMVDTDFDCTYVRDGAPQSAWDLHRATIEGEKHAIEVLKGPGASAYDHFGADFYTNKLLDYYAHVSILMRNDFLSDPDGPIPALHPIDAATQPILWYRGEDMRLRPDLLGPMVVAAPYTDRTPLLTDGNLQSGWASQDTPEPHWAEIVLPEPAAVSRVALHWPEWRQRFRTSSTYALERLVDGEWIGLCDVDENPERPWTVHELEPRPIEGLRVVQPPAGGFAEHPDRLWLSQVELY
jgi:hypothetical protein